jgi:hypothetical protein
MNNPLDRRMFNQQMMNRQPMPNQPSMGRQPMGILNSSPQLINAVQGYAQGGMVKGYNHGGVHYIPGQTSNQDIMQKLDRLNKAEFQPELPLNQTLNEPGMITSLDDVTKIKVEPSTGISNIDTSNAEEVNSFNTDTPVEVDEFGKSDVTKDQGINKYDMGESRTINEENAKILAKQKKVVDEEDNGAPTTTASDITTKAANSLEAWKKKQKNIDKRYEVTNKNSEAMYKEVQKVLEETDDDIDLEAVERMAKKALGLKDGKEYDEDKTTAFWMAVIKGGLATAAGESANALTNIAKGLSFGVDSYGKDMNSIADDEREDRKDLAKMKYELIKDEKSARIAKRTLKLQGYQALAAIENRKNEFASTQDYQKQRDVITDAIANANLDLVAAQTFHKIGMDGADYDLNLKKFALDVKKQKQYIKLNNDKLNQDYKLGTMTTEMKNIYSLGDSYVSFDKDSKTYSYTPLGEQALIAATVTKTTMTDLKATAASIGETKKLRGLDYPTKEATVSAYYRYEGVIKPKLEALSKTSEDRLGKIDMQVYQAQEQEIMKQFAIDSGALNVPSSGTSTSVYRTMPKAIIDKNYSEKSLFTSNGVKYIVGPNNTYTEAD